MITNRQFICAKNCCCAPFALLGVSLLCVFALTSYAQSYEPLPIDPPIGDLGGGALFQTPATFQYEQPSRAFFNINRENGVPIGAVFYYDDFSDEPRFDFAQGLVPEGIKPGIVDVEVRMFVGATPPYKYYLYPAAFTYVDAPLVDSMEPTEYSIGPDNRVVTLEGVGFPINRAVEVWVGDAQAEVVPVRSSLNYLYVRGQLMQFRPPPFPGGEYPLTVDVRVVTVGGGETVLEDAFTYDLLLPEFTLDWNKRSAWKSGQNVYLSFKHVDCDEELEVYFDGESAFCGRLSQCSNTARWGCVLPNHPPGYITVTVIDSEGNSYSLEDGFRFTRSSPLHSADRDGDGVVSLSELLRVVQFYNEGGYRCAPEGVTSEDGFLPGPGVIPEGCRPHDSDLIDWDWQVDLSELLETIQLYNFGPYTLCADEVFFCPAE